MRIVVMCTAAAAATWMIAITLPARQTPAGLILGTWHGTSICVDKAVDRACHDEEVIYDVDSAAGPQGPVRWRADKVVAGVREEMGTQRLTYDPPSRNWTVEFSTPRAHARWDLAPRGDSMSGTLRDVPSLRLVRRVNVRRVTRG